ncbi:hypothetical protein BA895_22895 [Humibacillus sp. DSM 29435]|uniref:hypothetical protein n=1 Tax=Humibacillus sp. DSM 29435 TaxID=1869167 RepID=UPI0008732E72|nr:hypothetical protein [Humibacillus sp. DSM 29435]OFE14907.1 hypothetical protein BA895_22895 [Humibacillus sp. DSM 29435]
MDKVFDRLRAILDPYLDALVVTVDGPGNFYLNTADVASNGRPRAFGGVQTKKNYVSYHLMPVYENPDLLRDISPKLRARMQGKSCFNFKTVDEDLFAQLADLTGRGYSDFEMQGKLSNG